MGVERRPEEPDFRPWPATWGKVRIHRFAQSTEPHGSTSCGFSGSLLWLPPVNPKKSHYRNSQELGFFCPRFPFAEPTQTSPVTSRGADEQTLRMCQMRTQRRQLEEERHRGTEAPIEAPMVSEVRWHSWALKMSFRWWGNGGPYKPTIADGAIYSQPTKLLSCWSEKAKSSDRWVMLGGLQVLYNGVCWATKEHALIELFRCCLSIGKDEVAHLDWAIWATHKSPTAELEELTAPTAATCCNFHKGDFSRTDPRDLVRTPKKYVYIYCSY